MDLGRPLIRLVARRRSAALSAATPRGPTSTWIGIEHEFLVLDATGARVDFRRVIHGLRLGRPDLMPLDRNAYPVASGSVVTADNKEAEIAIPPTAVASGFARRLDGWAAFERAGLARRTAPMTLKGDSTHLNVTLPPGVDPDRVADLFATRFALGLMLLMDQQHSPGLLVRPRPYRLELGGEYAVGRTLRSAVAYAVGGALACIEAAASGSTAALPPALDVKLERGVLRYGWYVARTAFGGDLYSTGRSTAVARASGESWQAGEALAAAWSVARHHLGAHAGPADVAECDKIVAGSLPLPIEAHEEIDLRVSRPRRPRSEFGSALKARRRPMFELAPVMLTWQAAVFLVVDVNTRRLAYVAVPGYGLNHFLRSLDGGSLDGLITAYLALRPSGRRLRSVREVRSVGMFDELGLRAALLAPERDYWGRPVRLLLASTHASNLPVGQAA
ncbi:MAG TPA: hypothetical protein VML96_11630 [Egibacteraceae bacterium]|nr:hypothetical protein [Egibacteraceae bacterium]